MYDTIVTNPSMDLFGGSKQWLASGWTSSDDRVRGGVSQSYLKITDDSRYSAYATFYGTLDIKTLGNAGFASQRTTENQPWNLSPYDGILLNLGQSDENLYTFYVKDELPPKSPNGTEQSSISWEYHFNVPKDERSVLIMWSDFTPTFRGHVDGDALSLNTTHIQRLGIMMRSFSGRQEGNFSLDIISISAAKDIPTKKRDANLSPGKDEEILPVRRSWFGRFFRS